jgi:hypothetical protein
MNPEIIDFISVAVRKVGYLGIFLGMFLGGISNDG